MFEPFTKEARTAVAGASREATSLRHHWIGTEHMLLALVGSTDRSRASQLLAQLGAPGAVVRSAVLGVLEAGDQRDNLSAPRLPSAAVEGHPQPTPRLRNALARSAQIALRFEDLEIRTEHILLALLASDGIAQGVLESLSVSADAIVLALRDGELPTETAPDQPSWPVVPMTAAAVVIPEFAHHRALQNGTKGRVGTQHFLLALTIPGGVAAKTLAALGLTYEVLKERIAATGGHDPES